MQDPKQKQPGAKQYFDIKGPTRADATSRPGINNEPIQSDPMVTVTSPKSTSIKVGEVSDSNPDVPVDVLATVVGDDLSDIEGLGIKHVDEPGSALPEDQVPVKKELLDLTGVDSDAVVYDEPTNKKAPDIETLTLENIGLAVNSVGDNHVVDLDKKVDSPAVSEESVHPSDFSGETTPAVVDPTPPMHKQAIPEYEPLNLPVEPFPIKHEGVLKNNTGLKVAVALLVLILLVVISFVGYKYKTGQ